MDSWVGKICWRTDRLPTVVFLGFPCGSASKESACNAEDLGSILGLGRSPGEVTRYPPQYSGLESSMDCIINRVSKSQTRLSNIHFTLFSILLMPFINFYESTHNLKFTTLLSISLTQTIIPFKERNRLLCLSLKTLA